MAKKKGTPENLDWLFDRDIIDEDDYGEFWSGYWESKDKERFVSDWTRVTIIADNFDRDSFPVTKSRTKALEDARTLKASASEDEYVVVVRRDTTGKFNSRGRSWQAIRRQK